MKKISVKVKLKNIFLTAALAASMLASEAQSDLVSYRKPDGLVVSTGNLYFTSHDDAGAAVWRISQNGKPGEEKILYWEADIKFGDIVYAKVGFDYFGYFFAEKRGTITIKRVSLTGGNAVVLATLTNIDIDNSHHNLITDGTSLYWQDVSSIRKMSVNGGAITTLDGTGSNTPTAGIDLQGDRIIYADRDKIYFVPTTGAIAIPALRLISARENFITSLHVASATTIYWSENDRSIRKKVGGIVTLVQAAGPNFPTSISSSGTKVAWTQCASEACQLKKLGGATVTIADNAFGLFVSPVPNKVFWADEAGVHKRSF